MNGPTQTRLLERAGGGWGTKGVVITANEAERSAARRLAARGILTHYRFGNGEVGFITCGW